MGAVLIRKHISALDVLRRSGGLLGAVAAWADGQIGGVALLAALWAAAQACFIRAGIGNEVSKAGH